MLDQLPTSQPCEEDINNIVGSDNGRNSLAISQSTAVIIPPPGGGTQLLPRCQGKT